MLAFAFKFTFGYSVAKKRAYLGGNMDIDPCGKYNDVARRFAAWNTSESRGAHLSASAMWIQ
jgi:hypothetical protein